MGKNDKPGLPAQGAQKNRLLQEKERVISSVDGQKDYTVIVCNNNNDDITLDKILQIIKLG